MGKWLDKDGLIDLKTRIKTKVDTKVDKYTEESAGKFLQTDSNGNAVWGTAASPSAVAEATEQWLDDHVSGGSTIAVDDSLTVEGAAADAKATGALVKSAATQPTDNTNKLWINESSETEYQVPTYGEFSDLKSALNKTGQVEGTELDAENSLFHLPDRNNTDAFCLSDKNGNVIAKFDYQGNLQTKGFDASVTPSVSQIYSPLNYNFAIKDANGNIAFGIINGLAITNQRLFGKKLAIVGDSISTFTGYTPSPRSEDDSRAWPAYYPNGAPSGSDVTTVEKTWWKKLINELGLVLIRDASWSGSTVSGDSEGTAECACSDARINKLVGDDSETPDIIICYIGTNDWGTDVQIGSFTSHDNIPSEGIISEISKAYALMLYKIRTRYPSASVYCVTCLEGRTTSGDISYPIENGNGDTIHDVNHAIMEVAHIFGCHVIDLNVSGIHFWSIGTYTVDGRLHPNSAGMEIIKEVVKMNLIYTYHNM